MICNRGLIALNSVSFFGFGPYKGYQFSLSQSLNRVRVQEPSRHTPIQNLWEYPPFRGGYSIFHFHTPSSSVDKSFGRGYETVISVLYHFCQAINLTYRQTDRQTDRHVFIWGLIQRKYIDYNFQISKNYKQQVII